MSEDKTTKDDPAIIDALRDELTALGVSFHHKNGEEKLRELLAEAMDKLDNPVEMEQESIDDMIAKATSLERVVIYCNDPDKREYKGDFFSSGNVFTGIITKYVPFGNEKGWHVPHVIMNSIREAQLQLFKQEKDPRTGIETSVGYLTPAYTVKTLEQLTQEELDELATEQIRAGSIDAA